MALNSQRSMGLCLLSAEIKGICHHCPVGPRHCNKPHLAHEDSRVPGEAAERQVARGRPGPAQDSGPFSMLLYLVVVWWGGTQALSMLGKASITKSYPRTESTWWHLDPWNPGSMGLSFEANFVLWKESPVIL